jgi:adenylate kinase
MNGIIVIGPPGSGKDTQIDELAKDYDIAVISGGDIVREIAKKNSKIRETMDAGGLVDDDIILSGIDKLLDQIPAEKVLVFDGVPRNMHQAESINEILSHHNRLIDAVIYIELEEETIVERLSRRRVCALCGINIPSGADKCVKCGGRSVQRDDDTPAAIIRRVQTFLERTLPLVNYYQNKGILTEVDGDQPILNVAADIKEKLGYVQAR